MKPTIRKKIEKKGGKKFMGDDILIAFSNKIIAPADGLFAAFEKSRTFLCNLFYPEYVTFKVLGSAKKGTALNNDQLDIDIDMIFSHPYGLEAHGGLSDVEFLMFVDAVYQKVKLAIDSNKSQPFPISNVTDAEVTRSFNLKVNNIRVEIFPKYRQSSPNNNMVESFSTLVGHGMRIVAQSQAVPIEYIEQRFESSNLTPSEFRFAVVLLKYWKFQSELNLFKSYHLTLLGDTRLTVDGQIPNHPDYFNLPQGRCGIVQWIVALFRRIVAIRWYGAELIFNGQHLHAIDYRKGPTEKPQLNDFAIPPFTLTLSPPNFPFTVMVEVDTDTLLGNITSEELKLHGSKVSFRLETPKDA